MCRATDEAFPAEAVTETLMQARYGAFDRGFDDDAARARLETVATLLDAAVRVPGTRVRFGADAVLNLIPGLGTLAAQALSAWIILEARRLGVPTSLLLQMIVNLGIDSVVSSVPVVGWVADVLFKANRRNVDLLRRHLDGPARFREGAASSV
jgi:hypothetical protein